jgi:release factor glutamine methyltransferase
MDVVRLSTKHLAARGSGTPRLDAELLAAHSLGIRRLDLYLQFDRPLDDAELAPIRALLRRRAAGEPIAYIVGEREFYGRAFAVSPAVLIPRPETELLVERALVWLREGGGDPLGAGLRAADLGTGSGCIAVTLACEAPGLEVAAGDVSGDALDVARGNARRHGVEEKVSFARGPWWGPFGDLAVDLLVSNPPYVSDTELDGLMRDVRDHEPRAALAAGDDGLTAYRELLAGAPAHLRPQGVVLLEIAPPRRDAVVGLVGATWSAARIEVHDDLAGLPRCVEAHLP